MCVVFRIFFFRPIGVRVTPSRLQAVALPIVNDHECRMAYGDNLAESMVCAGYREGGKSVCQVSFS